MRPMPPPMGSVQRLLSLASQLAVMREAVIKYQPLGRVYLRNGINVISFTLARPSSPAKDHRLRIKKPVVICSGLSDKKTTKSGPTEYFPVPSSSSVAVGN